MYTFSADASHPLLIQQAVACTRSFSLERVPHGAKPRIPDINVKFAFRLSTPRLLPALAHSPPHSPFVTEGETLLLSLDVTIFPFLFYSFPFYPHATLALNFQISFCLSTTFFFLPSSSCCCLEISTPLGPSRAYLYPFPSFQSPPLSLYCPSPLDLPPLLLPGPAHFTPVRNNKRSTRGITAPRLGRNRADLRPGSEKAIWANRTPPAEGGEGPADNEQPYGR